MNYIIERQLQLPDTIEGLSKFVLISIEKVSAIRAEIRAIKNR